MYRVQWCKRWTMNFFWWSSHSNHGRQDDTGVLITMKKIEKSSGMEMTDAGVAIWDVLGVSKLCVIKNSEQRKIYRNSLVCGGKSYSENYSNYEIRTIYSIYWGTVLSHKFFKINRKSEVASDDPWGRDLTLPPQIVSFNLWLCPKMRFQIAIFMRT